jgi:hypothetical protein
MLYDRETEIAYGKTPRITETIRSVRESTMTRSRSAK